MSPEEMEARPMRMIRAGDVIHESINTALEWIGLVIEVDYRGVAKILRGSEFIYRTEYGRWNILNRLRQSCL